MGGRGVRWPPLRLLSLLDVIYSAWYIYESVSSIQKHALRSPSPCHSAFWIMYIFCEHKASPHWCCKYSFGTMQVRTQDTQEKKTYVHCDICEWAVVNGAGRGFHSPGSTSTSLCLPSMIAVNYNTLGLPVCVSIQIYPPNDIPWGYRVSSDNQCPTGVDIPWNSDR